LKLIRL